jgi:hypothetical protein
VRATATTPSLERLAEGLEDGTWELGKLVEQEHAAVRECAGMALDDSAVRRLQADVRTRSPIQRRLVLVRHATERIDQWLLDAIFEQPTDFVNVRPPRLVTLRHV